MDFYGWFGGPGGGGGGGGGVTTVNGLSGAVVLAAGANITLTPVGNTITISSSGGSAAFQETPAGAVNSANLVYTLSQTPTAAASLDVFKDGLVLVQNVDYTLAGAVITMATAPLFGQSVYATYTTIAGVIGVTDVNGGAGSVSIGAGAGTSVTTVGSAITINAVTTVNGTRGTPQLITAVGGLSFSGSQPFTKKYIAGNGGPVIVTANPQIAAGVVDGQELTIQSRHATNTVELQDGTGLVMNGPWIGGLDSSITFTWDTAAWVEKCRQ